MNEKLITLQNLQAFKELVESLISGYVSDVTERDDEQDEAIQQNSDDIASIKLLLDKMDGTEDGSSNQLIQQLSDLRALLAKFNEIQDVAQWITDVNAAISNINSHIQGLGIEGDSNGTISNGTYTSKSSYFIGSISFVNGKLTIGSKQIAVSDLPSGIGLDKIDFSSIKDSAGNAATDFTSAVKKVSPPCDFSGLTGSTEGETAGTGVFVSNVSQTDGKIKATLKKLGLDDLPSARFGATDTTWATARASVMSDAQNLVDAAFNVEEGGSPNTAFKAVYDDVEALKLVINEFTPEGEDDTITNAINTLREVYAFLNQFADNQTLYDVLASLQTSLQGYANTAATNAASGAVNTATGNAKTYTDAEIQKLDYDGNEIGTGEIISDVTETDGKISVSKRSLAKADIPAIDIAQVNGLQSALDNVQNSLVFATNAEVASLFTATADSSMVSIANVE